MNPLVQIESVSKRYPQPRGFENTWALKDVCLNLESGQATGLVGESGAGKSTLARLLLGLEHPDSGRIVWDGKPVETCRRFGAVPQIQIIWQDPVIYLNPYLTVAQLISEPLLLSGEPGPGLPGQSVRTCLDAVGLPPNLAGRKPHELSGGQCQRVAIARALAARPRLLICDEPLSGLDIPQQAQILKLLWHLQHQTGLTCLFISHDLTAVNRLCSHVAVIRNGTIVESGKTRDVLHHPIHPYTRRLVNADSMYGSGIFLSIQSPYR